jgi:hypothetical protein
MAASKNDFQLLTRFFWQAAFLASEELEVKNERRLIGQQPLFSDFTICHELIEVILTMSILDLSRLTDKLTSIPCFSLSAAF